MGVTQGYRDFVIDQLGRVAPVVARAMFGGVGLYAEGLFFALIAEDRLYFKVDEVTRPRFERLGREPFRPFGEAHAMGYYELPADVLEDVDQLNRWMREAIEVARRAKLSRTPHRTGRGSRVKRVRRRA